MEWLCAGVVVSTSVDQRLNVWRVGPHSLTLCSSLTHDVADVAALKVHSSRYMYQCVQEGGGRLG